MSFASGSFNTTTPEKRILTVRQLNETISDAVRMAFPATVWIRGEVQRLPTDASHRTHVYFELHETGQSGAAEYQIPVSLMGWDRSRYGLGRYLDGTDPDFQLANKLEVCLECQVDFYAKFGKLSLKIVGVDKSFALGKLEASRRATLAFLKTENLLEKNASILLPEIPLRIGLITAAGGAAERDFMTGLEASPFGFQVHLQSAKMQGEQLQSEVIRALTALQSQDVQAIVITRGGGSRADLSWFDQKDLAVAVANCPVPVITAIGHEIDHSIADLVAHHSCKTPTAAAEFLVDRVTQASVRVESAVVRLQDAANVALVTASQRVEVTERMARAAKAIILDRRLAFQTLAGRFQGAVSAQLSLCQRRLTGLEALLVSRAQLKVNLVSSSLDRLQFQMASSAINRLTVASDWRKQAADRLGREALRPLQTGHSKIVSLATQARLLDPQRLLARGFTVTLGPEGKALTSAAALAAGDRIKTRFVDGEIASIVQPGGTASGTKQIKKRKEKRSGGKGKKENPGQETLFR